MLRWILYGVPALDSLHRACNRFGPGRLPKADKPPIGAGYAAASAAAVASILYGAIMGLGLGPGPAGDGVVHLVFSLFALPFVIPAAFIVGHSIWTVLPSYSPIIGVFAGFVGVVVTYLVTLILVAVVLVVTAALSLSGADPNSAALFSVGLISVAFYLTWWVTIPIGCLSGFLYVRMLESQHSPM